MIKKSFLACVAAVALVSSPSAVFAKVDTASYKTDFDEAVRVLMWAIMKRRIVLFMRYMR